MTSHLFSVVNFFAHIDRQQNALFAHDCLMDKFIICKLNGDVGCEAILHATNKW